MLVELLHSVTAIFDKYRAVRYQQSLARDLQQHRKLPQVRVVQLKVVMVLIGTTVFLLCAAVGLLL